MIGLKRNRVVLLGEPANLGHPLVESRIVWLKTLRQPYFGASKFIDLISTTKGNAKYNATFVNKPTWVGPPYFGYGALSFNGTNNQINSPVVVGAGTNYTICFWANWNSALGTASKHGVDLNNGSTSRLGIARFNTNDWFIRDAGSHSISGCSLGEVNGSWKFYALSLIGTTGISYVNGVQSGTGSNASWSTPASARINIGSDFTGGNFFGGLIDGVSVFSIGLSATQQMELYQEELLNCPTTLNYISNRSWFLGTSSGGTTYTRLVSDNIALHDQVSTLTGSLRNPQDNIGISDLSSRLASSLRLLSDNIGIHDSESSLTSSKRLVQDNLGVNDLTNRLASYFRLISDNIGISDQASIPRTGIQFDAASNSGYLNAQTTFSWSHTCTGTNRFLAVDISRLAPAGVTVTGITYNGVALSFIGAPGDVGSLKVECWGLKNPDSGTNTIAVTMSTVAASVVGTAVSYTGVDQTTPTEAFNSAGQTNGGVAADATVSVTTVLANDWIHAGCSSDDTAITANQTSRNNVSGTSGSGADEDTGPIASPGANSMSYTNIAAFKSWAIGAYGIRPAAGVTTWTRLVSDNIGMSDLVLRLASSFRLESDNLGFSDSIKKVSAYFRSLSDNLGISDTVTRLAPFKRSISDNFGVSDQASRIARSLRLVADSIAITDLAEVINVTPGLHLIHVIDSIGLFDSASTITAYIRKVQDMLGVSDLLQRNATSNRFVSDNLGISDRESLSQTFVRLLSDSIGVSDLTSRTSSTNLLISDSIGLSDLVSRSASYLRVLTDYIGLMDLVRAMKPYLLVDPYRVYGTWMITVVSGTWKVPVVNGTWVDR